MARLYANENFPLATVKELRRLGHDVLTTQEAGQADRALPVRAQATAEQRAVLTFNRRHFFRLHAGQPQHAGSLACSFDPDFVGLAQRIHDAIAGVATLNGQLLRVYRGAAAKP